MANKIIPVKKGDTGGVAPGSAAGSKRNSPYANTGGGDTSMPIAKKTRVIGTGQY